MVTIKTAIRVAILSAWGRPIHADTAFATNVEESVKRAYMVMLEEEGVGSILPGPCVVIHALRLWLDDGAADLTLREFLAWDEGDSDLAEAYLLNGTELPLAPGPVYDPPLDCGMPPNGEDPVGMEVVPPLDATRFVVVGDIVCQVGGPEEATVCTNDSQVVLVGAIECPASGVAERPRLGTGDTECCSNNTEPEAPPNDNDVTPLDSGMPPHEGEAPESKRSVDSGQAGPDTAPGEACAQGKNSCDVVMGHPTPAYLDCNPVAVQMHRRVRKRDPYAKLVLAEVRAKFGVPKRTEANRLVVRRYADGIMRTHGVRAMDRAKALPFIVTAAFIPTDEDLAALAWLTCPEGRSRMKEYAKGGFSST